MSSCETKFGKISKSIIGKIITDIDPFCASLQSNKVKESKELFAKLHPTVQCLFLQNGWEILSNKEKYSDESYYTAFLLFKLFRGGGPKTYDRYAQLQPLEMYYKKALEWSKNNKPKSPVSNASTSKSKSSKSPVSKSSSSKSKSKSPKKSFDKEYQKKEEPKNDDPLYIYYTSLYTENPKSPLAITWLTEQGVYDDDEREVLVKKYKKLLDSKKLIK